MAGNKFKYYEITTTHTVAAKNQGDASALVARKRGVPGNVLDSSQEIRRITASEAKSEQEMTA